MILARPGDGSLSLSTLYPQPVAGSLSLIPSWTGILRGSVAVRSDGPVSGMLTLNISRLLVSDVAFPATPRDVCLGSSNRLSQPQGKGGVMRWNRLSNGKTPRECTHWELLEMLVLDLKTSVDMSLGRDGREITRYVSYKLKGSVERELMTLRKQVVDLEAERDRLKGSIEILKADTPVSAASARRVTRQKKRRSSE